MPQSTHLPRFLLAALAACVVLAGCQTTAPLAGPPPAQHRTWTPGVAAANPYAVEAGLAVLREGGSAADAAVAVQAVLGLVEPQSSGLGGGAFAVYYDAATQQVTAFDGRETAPKGASPDMFLKPDGTPMPHLEGVMGGRSTGVPGAIVMLGAMHARFGKLPWKKLFDPAIHLADQGFVVPKRLGRFANMTSLPEPNTPDARALFTLPDGKRIEPGDHFTNKAYAATLRQVAANGPRTILEPPISTQIIARTHEPPLPGTLEQSDFDAYQPRETPAVCGPFQAYLVCVPPPPSGGVPLLEMLAILDHTDIASRGPDDPQAWYLFAQASRLMFADRDAYVGDPAFIDVPVAGLLDAGYVAGRAKLIGPEAGPPPLPGHPAGVVRGRDATHERGGTSHFVIIDRNGNVVSMTTTVEFIFGSGRVVDGFFLNNQLTDFSFSPEDHGVPVANAVAGGKRPRSAMSPVIVLDREGRLVAAVGSPGGPSIIDFVAKALVGVLDWHLPMQQALDLPNLVAIGPYYFGEVPKFAPGVVEGLAARGVVVTTGRGEESGLHGFDVRPDGSLDGGADSRREGIWKTLQ